MLDEVVRLTGCKPDCVTMDGGYFSGETLSYADERKLNIYVPDNQPAQTGKTGFEFDEVNDEYECPCGERLKYAMTRERKDRIYRIHRRSCGSCERRKCCCGGKSRVKELWHRVNGELSERMSVKMGTDQAREVYSLRKQIVEPVFGNIKQNKNLRRLLLRGIEGAEIKFLLDCIAHNLGKIINVKRMIALSAA